MTRVLAVDVGYGDVKVVSGDESGIEKIYKFPTAIGVVNKSEIVNDRRLMEMEGHSFYVGEDATGLPSSQQIDVDTYDKLEKFAPILIARALANESAPIDKLVLGLSIAQIKNSGHYKARVKEYFAGLGLQFEIKLVPQGAGAKNAIDLYGDTFPTPTKQLTQSANYVGCDIGQNTLDIFLVLNGKSSAALVRGIPGRGIIVIASRVRLAIKEKYGFDLSGADASRVVRTGEFRRRGVVTDVSALVEAEKQKYIEELITLIENEFGDVMDKSDALFLFGGGAYTLMSKRDKFVRVPAEKAEFYNAVSFFLEGIK